MTEKSLIKIIIIIIVYAIMACLEWEKTYWGLKMTWFLFPPDSCQRRGGERNQELVVDHWRASWDGNVGNWTIVYAGTGGGGA